MPRVKALAHVSLATPDLAGWSPVTGAIAELKKRRGKHSEGQ